MSRVQANLVEWMDEKGYGFARLQGGTERIFVHVRSLAENTPRPKKGDELELEIVPGRNGKPAARDVLVLDEEAVARMLPYHVVTAAMLLIMLELLTIMGRAPFSLTVYYAALGAVSIHLYWRDKQAAIAGTARIRESWLLGVDMAGGIIGGLLAQHRYRHKKSKPSYQIHTLTIVTLHAAFVALVGTGIIDLSPLI